MEQQTTVKQRSTSDVPGFGSQYPLEAIPEGGAYVCNWSGHLLRIPEEGIGRLRNGCISMAAAEPLYVTKVSDSAFIPISEARLRARECDVAVNF